MTEPQNPIVSSLIDNFGRAWTMWRDAIQAFPEGDWRKGDVDYLIPVRHAYHMLMTTERYTCGLPGDEYMRVRQHGLDWLGDTDMLLDKDEMLEHLAWAHRQVEKWLQSLGDEGLLSTERLYPHTGQLVLGRALYLLRHLQHHLGDLEDEITRRGYPGARWR